MKRAALILILCSSLKAQTEVLDCVAAVVGSEVVPLSAVSRQIRLSAFMEQRPPEDTLAARKQTTERLIDQTLIHREIDLSGFLPPEMAEANARIDEIMVERKLDAAQFKEALAKYGFLEEYFKQEILWRISVRRFVDFRFAAGIQVSDAEIDRYYKDEFLPKFKERAPEEQPPTEDEVRDRIIRIITTKKTNASLDEWLAQTKAQLKVRVLEGCLQ